MFMNIVRERFDHVVNVVCNVMGMERAELLRSRKEEATDARSLLVYILGDELTDGEIAGVSEWTRQSVNFLRNNAYARIKGKWSLREAERLVRKALATDAQRII